MEDKKTYEKEIGLGITVAIAGAGLAIASNMGFHEANNLLTKIILGYTMYFGAVSSLTGIYMSMAFWVQYKEYLKEKKKENGKTL